jgi:cell division septation protein DedD
MRGVFDDEELEQAQERRDTELTLGSGTLLVVFLGLVLLSGLCFGLGYSVGHRGVKSATIVPAATTPGDQEPLQASGSIPKPSAIAQDVVVQPAPASVEQTATPSGAAPATAAQDTAQSTQSTAEPAQAAPYQAQQTQAPQSQAQQSQVRGAFTPGANAAEPQQPASASAVRPAFPSADTIMVQVAAVANPDDADVLMNALRKRSYPVSARRDQTDNLIHVRVGPFATRGEAEQWKMRLLNDGYNAIVQP